MTSRSKLGKLKGRTLALRRRPVPLSARLRLIPLSPRDWQMELREYALSDAAGNFDFGVLPAGNYRLETTADDLATDVRELRVRTGETLGLTIEPGREGALPMILPLLLLLVLRTDEAITSPVKDSIRARVESGFNPAVIVGVIDGEGRRDYFGLGAVDSDRDGEPKGTLDRDSVFEIGSITKVFTSIVLASMVNEGAVQLDDPVAEHLPATVKLPTRNGEQIRLVHLATHTSGLPRMPMNFAPKDPANPYADYTVQAMYDFVSSYALKVDIGANAEYSNLGVGLLGHVLSLVAEMPYERLVTERVLAPLKMGDTSITLTPRMRQHLASGHSGVVPAANWDLPTFAGAGALRSTASDMLTFLAANLNAVTGADQSELASALRLTHEPRHAFGNDQIGLGWIMFKTARGRVLWHNGGTGGYRSFAGFRDDGSRAVVVLTNSDVGCDDIGFNLLDEHRPLSPPRATVMLDRATLAPYAGKYQLAPGVTFDVELRGRNLTAQLTGQSRFTLYAQSPTQFFYAELPATITFEKDALVLHQGGVDQRAARLP
ncbi:MAG: serine hydrolase [Planctomycetota bacterium]